MTAVQWLESLYYPNYIPKEIIEQAKEMEKQKKEDFAIGFAEWIDEIKTLDNGVYYLNSYEELLEIYKKEKGL
jgi:hypothetical protein